MSDDLEQLLKQLTPRGAPPPLRDQVLGGVARELANAPPVRRRGWAELAVAASIVLAVGLNIGVEKVHEARLAAIRGPSAVPREIAEMTRTIEKVTDKQTASSYQKKFLAAVRSARVAPGNAEQYWTAYALHFRERN